MSNESVRDVIIVGSGPAGYTAAVYAARADLKPLVFEGEIDSGGALMTTTDVENFPGFPDGIMGPELMEKMRAQAERFGAEIVTEDIVEMDLTGDIKIVKDGYGNAFAARTVILAMGSGYRKLGLESEDRLSGHGVSWCATCDGFFFRDKDIAVVGGGDSAVEEATFLTRFAKSVTIVHRRDGLRASKIMAGRALHNPKISFAWNSVVTKVHGDKTLRSVTLQDTVTGAERELPISGLFIAIGHDPRSDLVKGQVHLDPDGYVITDSSSTRTNLPGVFASGDLVDRTYRQAVTLPAPDARPLSTRSATLRRSTTQTLGRRRGRGHAHRRGQLGRLARIRSATRESASLRQGTCVSGQGNTDEQRGDSMGAVTDVTDATFNEVVLKSDKPVVVDFWADWCGPCKQVSPIIEELASAHGDKVTFVKMDTNTNPVTPANNHVLGLPTIQVYVGGELVKAFKGAKSKSVLLGAIQEYL
jgi:thioredoxin reductase (NADPH)